MTELAEMAPDPISRDWIEDIVCEFWETLEYFAGHSEAQFSVAHLFRVHRHP
jgi:hypothetical protein